MEGRNNHQKALAELPWPETAFQNLPEQSGGVRSKTGTLSFSYPIQAAAVELSPLEINRMPGDTGQCACSPVVSDADFKRQISSELKQDYFCSHEDQRMSQSNIEGLMLSL